MPIRIFNTFDDPLAFTGRTQAFGVNDADEIVGSYQDATGQHGFLLSGGTYTTFDLPLATMGTFATGINASGQIVGFYQDSSGRYHGFLLSGGTETTLDDPLATVGTHAFGINGSGQIVGEYDNATGQHGFLLSGGIYTTSTIRRPLAAPLPTASTARARSSESTTTPPASTASS
jgi:probable HAF family extracellular repeat protein